MSLAQNAELHPGREETPKRKAWPGWLLLLTAAAALLWLGLGRIQLVRVDGVSMENTLHDGEILLTVCGGAYQRGDVVICWYPGRSEWELSLTASLSLSQRTVFVKRLVALPGDSVEIRQGVLYVNDAPVSNPARMGSVPRDYERRLLGNNEYFVMGDNRLSSHDSRADDVGPVTGEMLRGKVKKVIWPLSQIRDVR